MAWLYYFLGLAAVCALVIGFAWIVDFYCDYFLNWEKSDEHN